MAASASRPLPLVERLRIGNRGVSHKMLRPVGIDRGISMSIQSEARDDSARSDGFDFGSETGIELLETLDQASMGAMRSSIVA